MNLPTAIVASVLLLMPALARADVIVVDAAGGGDHLQVQDAVDAASDGDVLLLREGAYAGFEIVDKALTVVAEGGTVEIQGGIVVKDLALGRGVTLIRMLVTGAIGDCPSQGCGLLVQSSQGAVRALSCRFTGATSPGGFCFFLYCPCLEPYQQYYPLYSRDYGGPLYQHDGGWDAVRVLGSDNVTLARCVLRGGLGNEGVEYYGTGGDGGHGLRGQGSQVALYECVLEGAQGAYGGFRGGRGGDGMLLDGDAVFASTSQFRGGRGGFADDFFISYGGDGGDGVHVASGGELQRQQCTFQAGQAGVGLFFDGAPGSPVGGPGAVVPIAGAVRTMFTLPPAQDGTSIQLDFKGLPGDFAVLAVSGGADYIPVPELAGVVVIGPGQLLPMGVVPPSGTLTRVLQLDVLGPGEPALQAHLQSLFVDGSLAIFLGSWSQAVILQPSFF